MAQKKSIRKHKKPCTNKIAIISILAIIVVIAIVVLIDKNKSSNNAATVKDSDLVIQISDISAKAKFYPVEVQGTKLEVLAVKAPDGSIRTAFNTCQVCYSSGRGYYKQEGNVLVCQNCGNRFGMDDVEVTRGGCNPVPITSSDKTVTDISITIPKEFLIEAKDIFANWKN